MARGSGSQARKIASPSAVGVVYCDASDAGFGGYFVQCGQDLVSDTTNERAPLCERSWL